MPSKIAYMKLRGVYGGSGHTSWTGKAERADYESVVGFMIEFLRGCEPISDIQEGIFDDHAVIPIQLILGGYSYGSWICSHLPEVAEVMKHFNAPTEASAAAEIKARAQHLATQTNLELRAAFAESRSRHGHTLSVGGEEASPEKLRRSGEASPSRAASGIRKSLDFARKLGSLRKKRQEELPNAAIDDEGGNGEHETDTTSQDIITAYLLVSPLLPPISAFTALPFGSNPLRGHSEETLQRLSMKPTLAVFGNDDAFTSVKKLRNWAQDLSTRPDSRFHFVEIEEAGHFWRTHTAQKALKLAIGHWAKSLGSV